MIGLFLVTACGQAAAAVDQDDPFARPQAAPAATAPMTDPLATLELTGLSSLGSALHVCVVDTQTRRTRWLKLGQPTDGLLAAEYDPKRDAVRLESSGTSRWIQTKRAAIATLTLPRNDDGSINWAHFRKSDAQKQREAEEMVTDMLEVGYAARRGLLDKTESTR